MDCFTLIGLFVIIYMFVYLFVLSIADCDFGTVLAEKFGKKIGVLKGKVIWITGASSGIGASLAEVLAKGGAKLVLSARNVVNLNKVKQKCIAAGLPASDVLLLPMDVMEMQKHEHYFQQVISHFGQLDILVNNAGRSQRALWDEISVEVDKEIFTLNVFSVISLSRIALRYFKSRSSGHLVVMGSLAGVIGAPYSSSYTGTKHALKGYFDSLRFEKLNSGASGQLDITMLCPGPVFSNVLTESFTETPGQKFNEPQKSSDKRMTSERCAELCAIAIANRLDESWIGLFPVIPLCYVLRYYPNIAKRHAVTGSLDGKLIIWDTWTGNKVQVIPLRSAWVMSVAFAHSCNFVACGGMDNMCTVYDVNNRDSTGAAKMVRELLGYEGFLSSCRFIDDKTLITGSGDMKICIWDLEAGKKTVDIDQAHVGDVVSMSLSPDKNTYVTGSVDHTCKLWDLRDNKCKQTFFGHQADVNSVCYHPNGFGFATGSEDKTARMYDIRSDQQVALYEPPNKTSGFTSCGLSLSGRFLLCGSDDHSVHVWDAMKNQHNGCLAGHENRITSLSVSGNGMAVATCSWDQNVRVWG